MSCQPVEMNIRHQFIKQDTKSRITGYRKVGSFRIRWRGSIFRKRQIFFRKIHSITYLHIHRVLILPRCSPCVRWKTNRRFGALAWQVPDVSITQSIPTLVMLKLIDLAYHSQRLGFIVSLIL